MNAAAQLMLEFCHRTGLTSEAPQQRYLWTDAFAVCNLLELGLLTQERHYTQLALELVSQVHHTLGQFHSDDERSGWLSGLGDADGELHPTCAGLRIGKKLPERLPHERFDERLEWDRDGQYFHYLTKWMHALNQVARYTGAHRFNRWAEELAGAGFRGFTYRSETQQNLRMFWKASVDLSRPLVMSMGQHDPLDGFVTCLQLQATGSPGDDESQDIAAETAGFASMVEVDSLATDDALGMGGLLVDAYRLAQLGAAGAQAEIDNLVDTLLETAHRGLRRYAGRGQMNLPADDRLAFRELGLAIGLAAAARLAIGNEQGRSPNENASSLCDDYAALADPIEAFWMSSENRTGPTWSGHQNINDVMLATVLLPDGIIEL